MKFLETKYQKAGLVIVILNILAMLNGMYYFLAMAKFTLIGWLAFNICAPSTLIFVIGYFINKKYLMSAAIPFMLFFGTGGMFIFSWNGTSIIAQIGHILMTLAIIYTIFVVILEKKYKHAIIGFFTGLIILIAIFPFQQNYVKSHPEYLKKLGDPAFEKFIMEQK